MNRFPVLATAAAAMVAVSLLAVPAEAATKRGTFAGCRWDYKALSSKDGVAVGISDSARDGHGCTIAAIDGNGFAPAVFVKDGSGNRERMTVTTERGCLTIVVYAAAAPDFGPAMQKKNVGRICV
jgi:hypothetical protein